MRSLFITMTKLLGVYMLYRLAVSIPSSISIGLSSASSHEQAGILLSELTAIVVCGIVGYLLAFRTEGVANLLRVPVDSSEPVSLSRTQLMHAGIILIAVFNIVNYTPLLVRVVYEIAVGNGGAAPGSGRLTGLLRCVAAFGVGLFMLFRPGVIIRFVESRYSKDVGRSG